MSHYTQEAVKALNPHFDNGIIDYAIISHAKPVKSLRAEVKTAMGDVVLSTESVHDILEDIHRYSFPVVIVEGATFTGLSYNDLMVIVQTTALI